jgi:hypothetical protein
VASKHVASNNGASTTPSIAVSVLSLGVVWIGYYRESCLRDRGNDVGANSAITMQAGSS